jgi:hypothetical protein
VSERTTYVAGKLDEVAVMGSAHLERMAGGDKRGRWFLSMVRADGTSIGLWFHGALVLTEERPAPDFPPQAAPQDARKIEKA